MSNIIISKDFITNASIDMISFYRANPVLAAFDLLGIDLAPHQQVILEDLWFCKYSTTVASRGSGKTLLAGGVIAPLFAILYPGMRIGFISSSFRQSRFLFEKAEETYHKSSIFRQATMEEPKRLPDSYVIELKAVSGNPPGRIEAIPIGTDGAKIRGARYGIIIIDEFAQVPKTIFDKVIQPMASTYLNPLENVRYRQRQKRLFEADIISEEEYGKSLTNLSGTVNRIFVFSSGYYTFNHLYHRFESQRLAIKDGSKDYAIHQVSYKDLPEGFLEEKGVENALRTYSSSDFAMEYEGEFAKDSEGFFKASLIEARKNGNGNNRWDLTVKTEGDPDKEYIMGVDPARSFDYFAIVIIELGDPCQVVYAYTCKNVEFPKLVKTVYDLCDRFNIVRIIMDKYGGGQTIADFLSEMERPIVDIELEKEGRKIVELFLPTNISVNQAANDSKALLEKAELWFPAPSGVTEVYGPKSRLEGNDEVYESVKQLIKQLVSIVVASTASGQVRFTIPGKATDDSVKKDLFSAFIMTCKAVFDKRYRKELSSIPILYPFGIIRERNFYV